MENLITPFGSISVLINNDVMEYQAIKLETNPILFPDIDGRYKIIVKYNSDNNEHLLSCIINDMYSNVIKGAESGERLECQSFYQDSKKLSIGVEFDIGYFNKCAQNISYDYDIRYLSNGMAYDILPSTMSHDFIFGIAWINNCTDVNDVQTWYGADPTIM